MYNFSYLFNNRTYYFRVINGRVSYLDKYEIPMHFDSAYNTYFIDDELLNRKFHGVKNLSFEDVNHVFQFSPIYTPVIMFPLLVHFSKNRNRLFQINQNNFLI
ncbi:hypothetical protein [Tenacibaculum sp. 47A_GOM-205m]|uniref:hypothetical protein n=1 Tax=Tenacibaculum sp. 47A_GOM-205m TaxID=1380384 RepID=UPI000491C8F6|nr:hypothetical protein [Tenacibaculum sp. 47A_GOM-205m]